MTRNELLTRHCRPLDASAALRGAPLTTRMQALPQWTIAHDTITRTYNFADYFQTIAFVNALAFMVHREDHHPDLTVTKNRCTVSFSTHSASGITENDLICAAKADAIFDQHYAGA